MEKFLVFVGGVIVIAFFLFVASVFGGTVVYFLWPMVAPAFNLPALSWGQCVALTWICSILLKPYGSTTQTK